MDENYTLYINYLTTTFNLYVELNDHANINKVGEFLCNIYKYRNNLNGSLDIALQVYELLQEQTARPILVIIIDIKLITKKLEGLDGFLELLRQKSKQQKQGLDHIAFLELKAGLYFLKGALKKAEDTIILALNLLDNQEKNNRSLILKINVLSLYGHVNFDLHKREMAEENFLRVLQYTEETDRNYCLIYNSLAFLYLELFKIEKACYYSEKTLLESKLFFDKLLELKALERQSWNYIHKQKFENAENALCQVLYLSDLYSNQVSEANAYRGLGRLFLEKGNFEEYNGIDPRGTYLKALDYLQLAEPKTSTYGCYDIFNMIAYVFFKLGDMGKCFQFRQKQLALAQNLDNNSYKLRALTDMIFEAENVGNYERATKFKNMKRNILSTM